MKLTIPQTVVSIPDGAGVREMKGVQNPEVQEFRIDLLLSFVAGVIWGLKLCDR
jgi:hypothetical protein